jgi:hypothetical protein
MDFDKLDRMLSGVGPGELTKHDKFRFAILEFGVREACLWFGHKEGDPFIKETQENLEEFLKKQTALALGVNEPESLTEYLSLSDDQKMSLFKKGKA